MLLRKTAALSAAVLSFAFLPGAWAQAPLPDGEDMIDATIVDVDRDERTVTFELEATNERTVELPVAEDAEIYLNDELLPKPRQFEQLRIGQDVQLQIAESEDATQYTRVVIIVS